MILANHGSRRILHPVNSWFIAASLLLGLLFNFMAIPRGWWWPDWTALILIFWCVREPSKIGLGIAFLCGLILDVGQGKILGQTSISYVLLAYASHLLASRMLWFRLLHQSAHVFLLLLATTVLYSLLGLALGLPWPRLGIFAASITGGILWPAMSYALLWPQYRPRRKDNMRPL